MFDLNDFDETLPGPWEWDVKRLAASLEIAGRENGFTAKERARRRGHRWPLRTGCAILGDASSMSGMPGWRSTS